MSKEWFNSWYRSMCIVYELACKCYQQIYNGVIQNMYKNRIYSTIQQMLKKGNTSSTLGKYFSQLFQWPNVPLKIASTPSNIHLTWSFTLSIRVTQAAPLEDSVHTDATYAYTKDEILHHSSNLLVGLISSCSELHRSCQHKYRYHRFSNDDPVEGE
jgi:hypothetical protein